MKPLFKSKTISLILLFLRGMLFGQNPYTTQNYNAPSNVLYPTMKMDIIKPGWHVVFDDEFDSSDVDGAKWWKICGKDPSDALYWSSDNVTVDGENLVLTANFYPGKILQVDCVSGDTNYYYYTSGGIKSNNAYYDQFIPGKYYEIRLKSPRGLSFHPCFYQFKIPGFPNGVWNEVDFFENGFSGAIARKYLGGGYVQGLPNGTDSHCHDTCYPTPVNLGGNNYYCAINSAAHSIPVDTPNPDFAEDFYTIGVEWEEDYLRWYLNNKLVRVTYADPDNCFNLLNNTIGGLFLQLGINDSRSWGVHPWSPWRDFDEEWTLDTNYTDPYSIDPDSISGITAAFNDSNNKYVIDYVRIYEKVCTPVETPGLYTYTAGYTNENNYPRLTGDINADGMEDIVAFGSSAVYASLSNGDGTFTSAASVLTTSFTVSGGWLNSNFPRFLVDVNGDDKADIVGMSNSTLYVSLSTSLSTPSFAAPVAVSSDFTISNGYTNMNAAPRLMGDLNGDQRADIVGFKSTGVFVSLSACSGSTISFTTPISLSGTALTTGYTNHSVYPRMLEDVNHDLRADIIGFGPNGVQVALSQCGLTTVNFTTIATVLNDFNVSHGYSSMNTHPRMMADVNGDFKKDIIAFGPNNTYIALSQSTANDLTNPYTASFLTPQLAMSFFTVNNGGYATQNDNPRFVADINCDGQADIIGIGDGEVKIALSKCNGTAVSYYDYQNSIMGFSKFFGYTNNLACLRVLTDVTGDNKLDLVGFGPTDLQVFTCFSDVYCSSGGGSTLQAPLTASETEVESLPGQLLVYPNPSNGEFTIRLNKPIQKDRVEVINLMGELVPYTLQAVSEYEIKIQTDFPGKGIHFLCLYDKQGNKYSEKVIFE